MNSFISADVGLPCNAHHIQKAYNLMHFVDTEKRSLINSCVKKTAAVMRYIKAVVFACR